MKINPIVFGISATLIVLFVILGGVFSAEAGHLFEALQTWITLNLGWFYIISVGLFLVFVLWLLVSPYGAVKLGKDDDEPEFSTFTWFAMLFSAGMGIGLLFFSVAEPVLHFDSPPRVESGTHAAEVMRELGPQVDELRMQLETIGADAPERAEFLAQWEEIVPPYTEARNAASLAAREAMTTTFFHWGLHAWAIYIIMGLSLAYFSFRHDLPLTIRSAFYPILGERIHGSAGYTIEILAVVATLFGAATSLGLGASQIAAGLNEVGVIEIEMGDNRSRVPDVIIITVVTIIATISVITGLKVGIRRLSEANLLLGLVLLIFVFVASAPIFLLSSFVQGVGSYAQSLVELTFRTDAFRGLDWQQSWTMFYWAWWIAWSPFVGMFIARVSRGRTIRQFVLGVLLAPTLLTFLWLVIFGNTALHQEMFGAGGIVAAVSENTDTALFVMMEQLQAWRWLVVTMSLVAVVMIATYFITSSDSASLVISILTNDGNPDPSLWTRVFWAVLEGAVAIVLLLAGGLTALQSGVIATALPICAILLCICWCLFIALRRERHWDEARRLVRRRKRDARLAELLEEYEEQTAPERALAAASAVPETGKATIGIDPEDVSGKHSAVSAWRDRLRTIMDESQERAQRRPPVDVDRIREQVTQLLDETVIPAFKEIREELNRHGRDVRIEKHPYQAVLTVRWRGKEEFSYAVRGRAYHKLSFAFPQFDDRDEARILRAEVVLPSGPRPDYKVQHFTKDGVIQDFLAEYARWRGVPLS